MEIPLLGIRPYINDDGIRCNYIGKVRNRIKKKYLKGGQEARVKITMVCGVILIKKKNIVQVGTSSGINKLYLHY